MARSAAAPAAPVSKKPLDSDFYQQRLKAWQPILTPKWVIFTFLIIGIPFVIIGFVLKTASDNVVEYTVQYDGEGTSADYAACAVTTPTLVNVSKTCVVNFTTTKVMKGPVYVYYELDNFYQNHRRYVKSRSDSQLAGKAGSFFTSTSDSGISDCDPLRTTADGKVLYPCGLIANSFFNDTFKLASSGGSGVRMDEGDIAWKSDREKKFGRPSGQDYEALYARYGGPNGPVRFINDTYPAVKDVTDEHFIVWMRPAALPRFRKLYGRLVDGSGAAVDIPEGTTLSFNVAGNYPVDGFKGKKSLVLSTVSFIGGRNSFLAVAYLVVGFGALGLSLAFALRQFFGGRKLGDTAYLVYAASRRA